jgi:DNA-binding NarL/FixJ family response regulator
VGAVSWKSTSDTSLLAGASGYVLKDAAAEELVVAKRSRVVPTLLLALRMKCY